MGRFKKMGKLYHRKRQRAREQLEQFEKGKVSLNDLNALARNLLRKRLKAGYELPGKISAKKTPPAEKS